MAAPILITVYDRLEHLKRCVASLLRCDEVVDTVLYIASDAAYRTEDQKGVDEVRAYILSIKGFKDLKPIFQDKNQGADNNYEFGLSTVFEDNDTVIKMEDDVVVGKGFLRFINDGLLKYYHEPRVLAVCGYMMPGGEGIENRPYFLNEITPYGEGLWRHKEWVKRSYQNPSLAQEFMTNWHLFKAVENQCPDNVRALPVIAKGEVRACDIQALLGMNKYNMLALFPPFTLSKSIGHDGTGMHSGVNPKLQEQIVHDGFFDIPDDLPLEPSRRVSEGIVASQKNILLTFMNRSIFLGYNFMPGFYYIFRPMRNLLKSARKVFSF